ncbi:MAG: DUF2254 domain-containing protein [Solirubrobacterales bacterium]|nr:DUF2254 domain-containing protein [Solirubrobacterales bacterium]
MSTSRARAVGRPLAFGAQRPRQEIARVLRRRRRLRTGIVQLLAIAIAVGLAFLAPHVGIGFEIATNRAIEMLIAVGAGTVTFIGIVFSLLFLVVQFGSTTFTPRLNLFRDASIVRRAFALYAGVVIYSFTGSLVIGREEKTSGVVPIVAFVGVLASLIVYRELQMKAFKSIQLASTLAQVARRGREVIDALYTADQPAVDPDGRAESPSVPFAAEATTEEIRWPGSAGILQVVDVPRLLRAAERHRTVIELKVGAGELIAESGLVAIANGRAEPQLAEAIVGALTLGEERTFEQDPALALRVLADIALRALSPAVNDPTTAVQALDAIDGLLRVLAGRDLDVGHIAGSDGAIRVALVLPTWDVYLSLALDEIIALPAASPNVARRILRLIDDLQAIAPSSLRPGLEARRRQVCLREGQLAADRPRPRQDSNLRPSD